MIYKIKLKCWEIEKKLISCLPKKLAHKWYYKRRTGEKLDLNSPKDFNEKLQWLIVNKYGEEEAKYADKVLVREYIKSQGFEGILPKVYGIYDSAEEIKYEKLPNKFVIKTNHGSGKDYYLICPDKNKLDKKSVEKKFTKALKKNYARKSLEYHYQFINRKIYCEEYIESNDADGLIDYKIFCFHGKPEFILVTSNRQNRLERVYYDTKWNLVDLLKQEYKTDKEFTKPKQFDKMLNIASRLSEPFLFARIDLYNIAGKIYFGEITLSPATGINLTYSDYGLNVLGEKLDLSKVNK